VILGNTRWLDNETYQEDFRRFIRAGGSALIATDANSATVIEDTLGVRVVGGEPVKTADPKDAYRGQLDCPLIREFNTSYPIFQGIETIATNRAGRVEVARKKGGIAVAPFPKSCAPEEAAVIPNFAMICAPGKNAGRILVLSDHSVFIN